MASETVDPIEWLHPQPYTGQYPLSSSYCTLQCGLGCKSQDLLHWVRCERATFGIPDQTNSLCGHSGYKIFDNSFTTNYQIVHWEFMFPPIAVSKILADSVQIDQSLIKLIRVWSSWPESDQVDQTLIKTVKSELISETK